MTGPSGVGKDTVLSKMKETGGLYHFTVTATTRPQRPYEKDGVDYLFVSKIRFQKMIDESQFLEWAEVYGNLYGVPKSQIVNALDQGKNVIIKVDVQGAHAICKLVPSTLSIFLAPPDVTELLHRLSARMTESGQALQTRIQTAYSEIREASKFKHVVVNNRGQLDNTVQKIVDIIEIEKSKSPRSRIFL